MIHSIAYSVTFPTTNRTLAENITFQPGLGAIVGANEAGKSFVVEMIRYALFGSAALRGKAEEYRNLSVELSLSIRKLPYRIVRTNKVIAIWQGDDQLATGTKPVNAKVVEILGYDLSVFDIANVANQGDIEKLIAMRPTERKQMIDRVVGLDRLDELTKWTGEEALGLAREAGALEQTLVSPTPPETPQFTDVENLTATVSELRRLEREYHELTGWLRQTPVEPIKPVDEYPLVPVECAEEKAQGQLDLQREVARLSALPPPSVYSNDQLHAMLADHETHDRWKVKQAFIAQRPRPTMLYGDVLDAFEAHRLEEHRASLQRQLDTAKASGTARCPCGQEFELEHHTIIALEEKLSALPAAKPLIDPATLKREEARHQDWNSAETNTRWKELEDVSETPPPALTRSQIDVELRKNRDAADPKILTDLRGQLAEEPIDWPTVRDAKRRFISQQRSYDTLKVQYDEAMKKRAEALLTADSLKYACEALSYAPAALDQARAYALMKAEYEKRLAAYESLKIKIEGLREREVGYRACRAAILAVRTKVKAYLIPALSKVASHLLAEMTGGQRSSILIDNDFENIIVDGQSIETLSGSGKACANLAIRIGLGQVLTNNVLSLFIGDEIDASMDNDRAKNVSELLVNLQNRILQLLLVTHKSPTADYTIRIGEKLNVAA